MRNNDAPDHIITKEEFEEYYNNVSASIDRDDYFELMMNSAWNLDGARVTKKGWKGEDDSGPAKSGARRGGGGVSGAIGGGSKGGAAAAKGGSAAEMPAMNYTEAQLMETFQTKLAARGSRGIMGLGRQFKIADDDRSGALGMEEFKKAVHDFRIGLSAKDAERLFKIFDRSGDGGIDYEEFLRGVRGEMNEFRKGFAMKAFTIMDKDKSG